MPFLAAKFPPTDTGQRPSPQDVWPANSHLRTVIRLTIVLKERALCHDAQELSTTP
jgi:hypothetical protein